MTLRSYLNKLISEYNSLDKNNEIVKLTIVIGAAGLVLALVTVALTFVSVTFTVLSFFGIHQESDLQSNIVSILEEIDNVLNIYRSFNVDLKILIWSLINFGFTFYLYKSSKTPIEDPRRIDDLTSQVNALEMKLTAKEENADENKKLNDLTAKIETLKNQIETLPKIQSNSNVEEVEYKKKMSRVAEGTEIYFKRNGISSDLYKLGWNGKRDNTVWILYLGVGGIKEIPEELVRNLQYLESKYAVNIKITDDTKQFLGVKY